VFFDPIASQDCVLVTVGIRGNSSLNVTPSVTRARGRCTPLVVALTAALFSLVFFFAPPALAAADGPQFEITFPASAHSEPITGRVFVMITRNAASEPRLQVGNWADSAPFFGVLVEFLHVWNPESQFNSSGGVLFRRWM
jgi:hypothetical protein